MKVPSKVVGQRLDVVLKDIREQNEASESQESEGVLGSLFPIPARTDEESRQGQDFIEAALVDFIMPIITDANIFQNSRIVSLLEYLQKNLLSEMDNQEELAKLAEQIIEDEIARHQMVTQRRQAEIAA